MGNLVHVQGKEEEDHNFRVRTFLMSCLWGHKVRKSAGQFYIQFWMDMKSGVEKLRVYN